MNRIKSSATAWLGAALCLLAALAVPMAQAQTTAQAAATTASDPVAATTAAPDPKSDPNSFVDAVAQQALAQLKADARVRAGDTARVNELIDQYLLPYVDFERTTRLSAGRYWRQATPTQQRALTQAFRATLVRTYGSALGDIEASTHIRILPFRGDAAAEDVVVHSLVLPKTNAPPVNVDFRLAQTASGWRIYDVNVEGIWLILNYRTQFADQIGKTGIDGLIQALGATGPASK